MKKTVFLASLALTLFAVSGCDFFRSMVGRPTSGWIADKEARIKADREFRNAIEDIISEEDSLLVSSDSSGMELPFKYYIVVGVFSNPKNAEVLAGKAESKGYECVILDWKNNKKAVTLNPTNDAAAAHSSFENISRESFCPTDVWMMDGNRQRI